MSIWASIKTAVFGAGHSSATPAGAAKPAPASAPPPASTPPASATTATAAAGPVDIEQVMKGYEAKTKQHLDWRTSIVDLLKLLNIDSSLANRTELAKELGYTGSASDTSSMNMWLHKEVLRKLQES